MFKIATWNVNSLKVRLGHVLDWLEKEAPDILALQEIKCTDENFPVHEIKNAGYQVCYSGQKTYNGVAIISKIDPVHITKEFPGFPDPQRRILFAQYAEICVLNIYIPNGSEIGSEKYTYKLDWLSHLQNFVQTQLENGSKLIILGDFNIAPADEDVHDPKEWKDKILVSDAERAEFFKLIDKGLLDCFRYQHMEAVEFSWWDYRAAGFRRNRGLRIDHILASESINEYCTACYIDDGPRKRERPSDHTPVVAEFDF